MKKLYSIALTTLMLYTVMGYAQTNKRKCATMDVLNENIAKDISLIQKMEQIELFTKQYISNNLNTKHAGAVITIPVVVHVIHNGEAVGTGQNIDDTQIISQIDAMNKDFRLLNSDSLQPSHPFWQFTADCEIEFCLAQQDEFGFPTTGIERYNYGLSGYTRDNFQDSIKAQTIWNRDKYLNLWTCQFDPLSDDSLLLGYAQFPGDADSTDGVVIRATVFGTSGSVISPNDLGRTVTHEVGHWLNLRHIWGDASCGNDSVADTKIAEQANYGCPAFPHNANSTCGSDANGEMYMNYMDYVDDGCMNMFTFGQKQRIQATLAGPRASLLSSNGCQTPNGISEINSQTMNIFPNPVSDKLQIEFSNRFIGVADISIINNLGQTLLQKKTFENLKNCSMDVSSLPCGFYLVKISNSQMNITKKFVINK